MSIACCQLPDPNCQIPKARSSMITGMRIQFVHPSQDPALHKVRAPQPLPPSPFRTPAPWLNELPLRNKLHRRREPRQNSHRATSRRQGSPGDGELGKQAKTGEGTRLKAVERKGSHSASRSPAKHSWHQSSCMSSLLKIPPAPISFIHPFLCLEALRDSNWHTTFSDRCPSHRSFCKARKVQTSSHACKKDTLGDGGASAALLFR
jgi:hypothetical protein